MTRGAAAISLLLGGLLIACADPPIGEPLSGPVAGEDPTTATLALDARGTFFLLRKDSRTCPSPTCGGAFVHRVNFSETRCADGTLLPECYVAEVHLPPEAADRPDESLFRGALSLSEDVNKPSLAVFDATEVWSPDVLLGRPPEGTFFRIERSQILCARAPCPNLKEAKLNSNAAAKYLQILDLSVGSDAERALALSDALNSALIVVGTNKPKKEGLALEAVQYYRRVEP